MSDDRLGRLMSELNGAPDPERAAGLATLVRDNNELIAATPLPFDSTPYAFVQWLATAKHRS